MKFSNITQSLLNAGISIAVPTILDELPHDTTAFTQGMAYANDSLYESTGMDSESSIRRIDPVTGDIELARKLPGHFGEGIAVHEERIVQLTWRSNVAFVYRLDDFSIIEQWPFEGEGWGLAATRDGFVMTNGSSELRFLDKRFHLMKTVKARRKGTAPGWLNDLESAHGRLFVHRLGDHYLFEIDPARSGINRLIDCSELIRRAKPGEAGQVINGIAYDPTGDIFYLTGKRWPLLFKVRSIFD